MSGKKLRERKKQFPSPVFFLVTIPFYFIILLVELLYIFSSFKFKLSKNLFIDSLLGLYI